jgi:hypothetical protein
MLKVWKLQKIVDIALVPERIPLIDLGIHSAGVHGFLLCLSRHDHSVSTNGLPISKASCQKANLTFVHDEVEINWETCAGMNRFRHLINHWIEQACFVTSPF